MTRAGVEKQEKTLRIQFRRLSGDAVENDPEYLILIDTG